MKKLILLFASVSILFVSCKKETINEISNNVKIAGIVIDAKTTLPIEDVSVSIKIDGQISKTVKTDKDGYFSLGDYAPTGSSLLFSKDGYLPEYSQDLNIASAVSLQPLTGKINLTVTKQLNNDGIPVVASNVPYIITLTYPSLPISGSTDSNGQIILTNFPEGGYYRISFNYTDKNNILYKQENTLYENMNKINLYGYSPASGLAIVSSNIIDDKGIGVENFDPSDSIVVVFNQPIDTTFANNNIYLKNHNFKKRIWSNNNMVLTYIPDNVLDYDSQYYFYISYWIRNADKTKSLNNSNDINFRTKK